MINIKKKVQCDKKSSKCDESVVFLYFFSLLVLFTNVLLNIPLIRILVPRLAFENNFYQYRKQLVHLFKLQHISYFQTNIIKETFNGIGIFRV